MAEVSDMPKKLLKNPVRSFTILSPNPDLAGLEVGFDCEGFVGLRCVADRSIGFILTRDSAITLAQLILEENKDHIQIESFSLAG
jgi:hypothetical protein